MPAIERPPPTRTDDVPLEPPVPLLELVRQRRERADQMQREALERELRTNGNGTGLNGNGSDDTGG